jgi:hypothetical protein
MRATHGRYSTSLIVKFRSHAYSLSVNSMESVMAAPLPLASAKSPAFVLSLRYLAAEKAARAIAAKESK